MPIYRNVLCLYTVVYYAYGLYCAMPIYIVALELMAEPI